MKPEKESYRVLCVSGSEKGKAFITELLPADTVKDIIYADTAASALVKTGDIDLCLINAPLPDKDAAELAIEMTRQSSAAVLLFVRADDYAAAVAATEDCGVFTVEKPNSRHVFEQAIALITAVKARERMRENKIKQLENKLDELKLVDRAKLVLIQYLKMDEAKAHRYIEKQAMDRRVTRREVAEIILSTYEY